MDCLNIAFSSDLRGFAHNATVIASVLRRTSHFISVKFYCQDFLPDSFESGRLKVQFLRSEVHRLGRYPAHVGSAVFDRLQVIRDASEWERCLVMDYDQLAFCDLAPLFETNFSGNLLAARLHGCGITLGYAMRHFRKNEAIPKGWEYTEDYPYFCMGPLLNLAAMRKANTWQKVLEAHAAFNAEEQIALTAATGGRTLDYGIKWNYFPNSAWAPNEIPDGVIHWTGGAKPWHVDSPVWRPDLWESEETTWEALRHGWWKKPLAVIVEPIGFQSANKLAKRGWQVVVVHPRPLQSQLAHPDCEASADLATLCESTMSQQRKDESNYCAFPDLKVIPRPQDTVLSVDALLNLRNSISVEANVVGAQLVRFCVGSEPVQWLQTFSKLPKVIVVQGPLSRKLWSELRRIGYVQSAIVRCEEWPSGCPDPSVLEFQEHAPPTDIHADSEIYLSCDHP